MYSVHLCKPSEQMVLKALTSYMPQKLWKPFLGIRIDLNGGNSWEGQDKERQPVTQLAWKYLFMNSFCYHNGDKVWMGIGMLDYSIPTWPALICKGTRAHQKHTHIYRGAKTHTHLQWRKDTHIHSITRVQRHTHTRTLNYKGAKTHTWHVHIHRHIYRRTSLNEWIEEFDVEQLGKVKVRSGHCG